jgi:hypothetical protein
MSLDINTPNGAVTLKQERRLAEIVTHNWPGCLYLHTPKDKAASVDAILTMNDALKAVAQASCRNNTLGDFRGGFHNEWLLTYEKLIHGRNLAIGLCVEYWGLVYLVPDDLVLRVKMFTPERGWLVRFHVEKTTTQATCNGGTATRDNAFIDLSAADVLTG